MTETGPPPDSLSTALLKPPLKWAGGKRWLLPQLLPLWTPHAACRLVEPFCGGLAIALGFNPAQALLNDINPHLINFYQQLQQGMRIKIPLHNDSDHYYAQRLEFNRLATSTQNRSRYSAKTAALFYYLNRTGYNGLCRFNSQGGFNVPFGRYKQINYCQDFQAYQSVLENWQFCSGDFSQLALQTTDFIYADPPYDVPFRQYAKEGFEWADQVRLAHWLAAHPGKVIASNQATPRIMELYRDLGFDLKQLQAPRRINCTGDRSPASEMLALRGF